MVNMDASFQLKRDRKYPCGIMIVQIRCDPPKKNRSYISSGISSKTAMDLSHLYPHMFGFCRFKIGNFWPSLNTTYVDFPLGKFIIDSANLSTTACVPHIYHIDNPNYIPIMTIHHYSSPLSVFILSP